MVEGGRGGLGGWWRVGEGKGGGVHLIYVRRPHVNKNYLIISHF